MKETGNRDGEISDPGKGGKGKLKEKENSRGKKEKEGKKGRKQEID